MIFLLSVVLMILGGVFCFTAYLLMHRINQNRDLLHLPKGEVTYADLHEPARALFSQKYRLSGKPDYILKQYHQLIPVEYKSGEYSHPAQHHILQLAAYCQLIEDTEHLSVPFGWIVYPTGRFQIPFDVQLRHQLTRIMHEMRGSLYGEPPQRNHTIARRCQNCSFWAVCPNKIE